MAKASNKSVMVFNLALMISLLLIVSMAEGRLFDAISFAKKKATPRCESVVGVQSGDTCFAVAQFFHLTDEALSVINPNLNCDKLFVGQWLCIAGTAN